MKVQSSRSAVKGKTQETDDTIEKALRLTANNDARSNGSEAQQLCSQEIDYLEFTKPLRVTATRHVKMFLLNAGYRGLL